MNTVAAFLDEHGERPLAFCEAVEKNLANADEFSSRDLENIIARLISEARWLIESRARWQLACRTQQITIHEEARA